MVKIDLEKGFEAYPNGRISSAEVKITSFVIQKTSCCVELYQKIFIPNICCSIVKNVKTDGDSLIITFSDCFGAEHVLKDLMDAIIKMENDNDPHDVAREMTRKLCHIIQDLRFKFCKDKWY